MLLTLRATMLLHPPRATLILRSVVHAPSVAIVRLSGTFRCRYFAAAASDLFSDLTLQHQEQRTPHCKYEIPHRVRQKVVSAEDAVALIHDGDTVSVSGFVAQGAPEAILKALGDRFRQTHGPKNLTLMFGGGPGDWDTRGLNHLAEPGLLKRTIGSHYGQIPRVANLALNNEVEAWTLPLGSISRMLRAQSTHSPGHITTVGIGTYLDPDTARGSAACNEAARRSAFQPVSKIVVDGQPNLMYRALPVDVAIIRGTTADPLGNITMEHESLLCDQLTVAAAARNSGGLVIAQVKRLAANGSLKSKDIRVPSPLVDCVVVVEEGDHAELHSMSYVERHNAVLTGEIRAPEGEAAAPMEFDIRKVIARRAFFGLRPNTIVNLGIGLPEGVANIAAEEGMLDYVTLSTEPGIFGGLPCSGHSFGPARNASALVEMNQMFDFYDGGLLDLCFLGAAQVSASGDVNVSRMSADRIGPGPGGFVDITQATKNVVFLCTFTAKGLDIQLPGDGTLGISTEGTVKKFVLEVFETTFSGDEAVRRGQKVLYVTERAVFRRTAAHPTLELIEIAPGVDLQKDVLDRMEFTPVVSPQLKLMDSRIFKPPKMDVASELFGSFQERATYHAESHMLYLDLFGIILSTEDDVQWFFSSMRAMLQPLIHVKGKLDVVINYDGFDCRKGLEEVYALETQRMEDCHFKSVKRYASGAFRRARLAQLLSITDWDPERLFEAFDHDKDGKVSIEDLRQGMLDSFQMKLTPGQIAKFRRLPEDHCIEKETFLEAIEELLKSAG